MNRAAVWLVSLFTVALVALSAQAQTYSNINTITIPSSGSDGRATPYGSTITVANAPSKIKTLSISLQNINHTYAGDIQALVIAPNGQRVFLVSGAASNTVLVAQTWIFNQEAAATLPTAFGTPSVSGIYRPTISGFNPFPAPVPAGPHPTDLSTLYGINPNGVWTLYVFDNFPAASGGTILGGWAINITGEIDTAFTYQGVLANASGPISGAANVRFSLMKDGMASTGELPLAGPLTQSFPTLTNGLVTTSLDFGNGVLSDNTLWLKIDVESPPGSGYVTLTPRQKISITPQAGRALVAKVADTATNATNAVNAQTVPWTGITGVPATITTPIVPLSVAIPNLSVATIAGVTPTTIPGTSVSLTLVSGQAAVSWSLSGYTDVASSGFNVRVRLGSQVGPWTSFFFNQGGVHASISGNALLPTTAGTANISLEIQRTSGVGSFKTDTNDSFTATILNIRQ